MAQGSKQERTPILKKKIKCLKIYKSTIGRYQIVDGKRRYVIKDTRVATPSVHKLQQKGTTYTVPGITYKQMMMRWAKGTSLEIIDSIIHAMGSHGGVMFETPGVTAKSILNTPFEFKLIAGSGFRAANMGPFAKNLKGRGNAKAFTNLSGDCTLVSPMPKRSIPDSNYAHLGKFMASRNVSLNQKRGFLKLCGKEMLRRTQNNGDFKTYMSTHGLGVPWLHMRICDSPKYYKTVKYR